MAPNTTETTSVVIQNTNDFGIRIHVRARKPVVTFLEGDYKTIKPCSKIKIPITYNAKGILGRYNVIIDFIVNGSDTFAVSVTAYVVPKSVKFSQKEIIFEPQDGFGKHLTISNPVNVPIKFRWIVPESCFTIEPMIGSIPAGRSISCFMSYSPHHITPSNIEVTLVSENVKNQMISVSANLKNPKIKFKQPKVEFEGIPLNLPVRGLAILQNMGREFVTFAILNPSPLPGIKISPTEGILYSFGEQVLDIRLKISTCIQFKCIVEIQVQKIQVIKLEIMGNVEFPHILVKPESIQLQKIVSNSFDRQEFIIANNSSAPATIDFILKEYTEYAILETENYDCTLASITSIELDSKQEKQLYLHFNPVGAALYRFYLPFVINGILGPVVLNVAETFKPSYFTEMNESKYIAYITYPNKNATATLTKMPTALSGILIYSTVAGDMIRFSKMYIHFRYFPHSSFNSETEYELKIWNVSKETCKFCIRTDNLSSEFSLNYHSGNEIVVTKFAIVCTLEPKEEVTLTATFNPRVAGKYTVKLPIYVRKYLNGNVFNYLTMEGWFPKPTICTVDEVVYFESVPLKCETEQSLFLRLKYHSQACYIYARTELRDLRIIIDKPTISKKGFTKEVRVLFRYSTTSSKQFKDKITFYCECGATCDVIIVGCSDNCTITTHPFMQSYIRTVVNPQRSISIASSNHESPYTGYLEEDTVTLSTSVSVINDAELTNFNDSSFPLFPEDHDQTEYAIHMRASIRTMEEWLFHQGFYGNCYYKIPEGISIPPETIEKQETKDTKKPKDKPKKSRSKVGSLKYVELLINLVGDQLSSYVPIREIPSDYLQKINYIYNVYSRSIDFIISFGGMLPHLLPEHLLLYNHYVTFMKRIRPYLKQYYGEPSPEILEEKKFFLFSKQAWLDLLLQTYKVFVLFRIRCPRDFEDTFPSPESSSLKQQDASLPSLSLNYCNFYNKYSNSVTKTACLVKPISQSVTDIKTTSKQEIKTLSPQKSFESINIPYDSEFWHYYLKTEARHANIFSESQNILLNWLEYHFNNQRETLWGPNKEYGGVIPNFRKVMYFGCDLSDGIALATVTIAYCPYLKPYLRDVYPNPTGVEQSYHNVSRLLQSWDKINLSFKLTPAQIVYPNNLQMIMLAAYLYEVLPTFYPKNVMNFRSGLSTTCTKRIILENLSQSPISYKTIFFRNDQHNFTASNDFISLPPRKKYNLNIKFHAKRICPQNVTMLLNGENFGRCYAKAIAFTLTGESIPSYCTTTIPITTPLYQMIELDSEIQAPYSGAASYEIHFTVNEPTNINSCTITPWATVRKSKVAKRILTSDNQLTVDEQGVGIFPLSVCCLTTNDKQCWVIFKNREKGDFTIKIDSTSEATKKEYADITVQLPHNFKKIRCHCKIDEISTVNKHCPRTVSIEIPSRNNLLWAAVEKVMMKIIDEEDLPFWKKYMGTGVGVEIQKWMTTREAKNETSYDIQHIFVCTVTYTINLETRVPGITLPSTTTIENVHSFETHEIPVHIESNIKDPFDLEFKLVSTNGLELRHYSAHFCINSQSNYELVNVN